MCVWRPRRIRYWLSGLLLARQQVHCLEVLPAPTDNPTSQFHHGVVRQTTVSRIRIRSAFRTELTTLLISELPANESYPRRSAATLGASSPNPKCGSTLKSSSCIRSGRVGWKLSPLIIITLGSSRNFSSNTWQ